MTSKKIKAYFSDSSILLSIIMGIAGGYYFITNFGVLAILLYLSGWAIYLVQENLIHRYIFHLPKSKNKYLFLIQYRIHAGHHDQPYNSKILFTPAWFSIITVSINIGVLLLLGMPLEYSLIMILGGGVHAYLVFEWVHISCHIYEENKSKLIKSISKYHNRHHFLNYNLWFSISPYTTFLDKVFGTDKDVKDVTKPEHVRSVGISEDDDRLIYARSIYAFSDDLKGL